MALSVNNPITPGDINEGFRQQVMNVILAGANDINSVPRDGGYECVPSRILGNIATIPAPNVGHLNGTITAAGIYNNLVSVTTILTRVGTWSYIRTYGVNKGQETRFNASGKAFFNEGYVRSLAAVSNPGVTPGSVISVNSINQLYAGLLNAWNATQKHHESTTIRTCHSDCHNDCYSDCNCKSSCYK